MHLIRMLGLDKGLSDPFLFRENYIRYNERKNDHGEHGLARRILKIREIGDTERI